MWKKLKETGNETSKQGIQQEWDALRTQAWSASERAEIDAIFARYVA